MEWKYSFTVMLVTALVAGGCIQHGCGPERTDMTGLEVYEWGVFTQKYGYVEETASGIRPLEIRHPKYFDSKDCKPVIYFHGEGFTRAEITVHYNGSDVLTIPRARYGNGSITWNIDLWGPVRDTSSLVRIIDDDDRVYDSLLYEGTSWRPLNIVSNVTVNGTSIIFGVTNIGAYTMQDVFIHYKNGSHRYFHRIPHLDTNESISVELTVDHLVSPGFMGDRVLEALSMTDLSPYAIEEIADYWIRGERDKHGLQSDRLWFHSDHPTSAELLYFIPEEEYHERIRIEMVPEPEKISRVGLCYITDIPVLFR